MLARAWRARGGGVMPQRDEKVAVVAVYIALDRMDSFLELALTFLGRLVVRVVSFGRWSAEAWTRNESSSLAPAGALSYVSEGRRVVTYAGQQLAGLALIVVLAVVGALYANAV